MVKSNGAIHSTHHKVVITPKSPNERGKKQARIKKIIFTFIGNKAKIITHPDIINRRYCSLLISAAATNDMPIKSAILIISVPERTG
jgi:hypothetical protein